MVVTDTFPAAGWGTTNRRVFTIRYGAVVVADFPAEIAATRERFGATPMLLAGMIGSAIG